MICQSHLFLLCELIYVYKMLMIFVPTFVYVVLHAT